MAIAIPYGTKHPIVPVGIGIHHSPIQKMPGISIHFKIVSIPFRTEIIAWSMIKY